MNRKNKGRIIKPSNFFLRNCRGGLTGRFQAFRHEVAVGIEREFQQSFPGLKDGAVLSRLPGVIDLISQARLRSFGQPLKQGFSNGGGKFFLVEVGVGANPAPLMREK